MLFTPEEISEFKIEAFELLAKAEESLLALDKGAELKPHYDTILRSFHNIKGGASIIESDLLQEKMHELETLLTQSEKNGAIPKEKIDLFLKGIDASRTILNQVDQTAGHTVAESPAISSQVAPQRQGKPAQKAETPSAQTSVSEAALNEFLAECGEITQRLSLLFDQMEKEGSRPELIDKVYRDIHTLKGSAQLFGFNEMGSLAHAMESSLDPIRKKGATLSESMMDTLYLCLDLVERMAEVIEKKESVSFTSEVLSLISKLGSSDEKEEAKHKENSSNPEMLQNFTLRDSSGTIRVPVELLDRLMSRVGEMVLVRNQVLEYSAKNSDSRFQDLSKKLNQVTGEIQEELMKTRMQPIGNVLEKFHRIVRDLAKELKKEITLQLKGNETELDKTLLEAIKDPLTHIIRNSCDHGIETPKERLQAKKNEIGTILVRAYHEGGQVIIEVSDDGKGLDRERILAKALDKGMISVERGNSLSDRELFNFIFEPGFSTAEQVTNVSGRGVGMDVVKSNIDRIGGVVELESEKGKGTKIQLKIPLTLAIVPALIVRAHQDRYAIPQVKLVELVRVDGSRGNEIEYLQGRPIYRLRGSLLPLLDLKEILEIQGVKPQTESTQAADGVNIVVLKADRKVFGLIVDEILDTADIVVKPLSRFLKSLALYSGATIMGDGGVALILDVTGIAQRQFQLKDEGSGENENTRVDGRFKDEREQDFLLFKINSPTKHAMHLGFVHRIEEFKAESVEWSGHQRVVRYRNSVLPLFSLNDLLHYPKDDSKQIQGSQIQVIVMKKDRQLFGLEVGEILDTLSTHLKVDMAHSNQNGILGNLVTENEVIVVVDPDLIKGGGSGAQRVEEVRPATTPGKERNQYRILFVEDISFIRKHVSGLLERAGYLVVQASNGQEALDILKSSPADAFHLIVSDIEMPKINGFELARKIRQDDRWNKIHLIALTSRTEKEFENKGKEAGFNAYLDKDSADNLVSILDHVFEAKRGSS